MEGFLILVLFILAIWLVSRMNGQAEQAANRLDRLERQIVTLEREVQQLRKPAGEPVAEPAPSQTETAEAPPDLSDLSDLPVATVEIESPPPAAPQPPPLPRSVPKKPTETRAASFAQARPATPSPPPTPAPRNPEPAFDWRPFLERIYLWPPSGTNAEAAIGAWWLTRIGLIIFILAAVFFGIRIAQDVPPWMRVATLTAIALGVTALGSWLERRLTAFGRLIAAGGLGLGYFTAYAAYGIEATKVIDHPAVGFFAQIVAVAAVVAFSLWKRDEIIGTMSLLLGYVACWFSHWHDLDQFMIAALLFLATGAGMLHWARHWRWPLLVATVGSWIGFLILGVTEWPKPGLTPSLSLILVSLGLLMTILEAANFLAEERSGDDPASHPVWRRWLAVVNTSLGVAVGWLAVRLAHPRATEAGELDAFFLVFAVLIGLFAALRFWRKHPTGLTEAYFLKASGLVALFVVECYDGPTRWLSLSVQALILLWAWQRSRLKWIEIGFWILLAATLAVIWHDVLREAPDPWELFNMRHLIGALSLALLSAGLALHARWSRESGDAGLSPNLDGMLANVSPGALLRFLAALAVGAVASPLVLNPTPSTTDPAPLILLSVIAMVIGAPAAWLRRFPPVAAGLAALVPTFVLYLTTVEAAPASTSPFLWTGVWLALLGLGMAELALRLWRNQWVLGNGARMILQGFAVVVLAVTLDRFAQQPGGLPRWLSLATMTPFAVAGVWALHRQSRAYPAHHFSENPDTSRLLRWLLAAVVGFASLAAGRALIGWEEFAPSILACLAASLFGAAWLTRNHAPALAGGIPLLVAIGSHLGAFHGGEVELAKHLPAALPILLACWGTAFVLWKKADASRSQAFVAYDLALHALALLVLHWIYRTHLDISATFLADALTALAVVVVHRFAPFRALATVSFLPLGVALIHLISGWGTPQTWGERGLWWPTAAVIMTWLWIGRRWFLDRDHASISKDSRTVAFVLHEGFAAAALAVAGFHALENPWHLVSLAGFAAALAALGRFDRLPSSLWWSALPLGGAVSGAWLSIFGEFETPPQAGLIAISLVAGFTLLHGIVVTWGLPRKQRSVAWIHGLVLLLALVFPAYAVDRLGVESLTTVCWGIASVILFIVGFAAALRPYRLTGLIGLALAMGRMFLVDIDDPLYRIYAFFVIALVLLGMGYLYHRFRHLIERADRHLTGDEPETQE